MKYNKNNIDSEILSDNDNDNDYYDIKNKKKYNDDNDDDEDYDIDKEKLDKDKEDKEDKEEDDEEYENKENNEEEEIDEIINEEECIYEEIDIQNKTKKSKRINDDDRITINRLTKYEKTKIICARSQQIENGSKIMLKYNGDINKLLSIEIAELELQNKVIPILIKRFLPNGDYEIWKISELL